MSHFAFDLDLIGRAISAPLVVVMPIYNEEANIEGVLRRWSETLHALAVPFQIIALDDGSRDRTRAILLTLEAAQPEVLCIISKTNSGHGITCRMGYDVAVSSGAEWVLQIDSDGQCEPKHFAEFWQRRANADCIFGIRTSRGDGVPRIITSAICRIAASIISWQDLKDPNVPYRLMRREVLQKALRFIPPSFNIHNVALTCVLKKFPGLRWNYVPIHFPDRAAGQNSINILKVVTWGAEMLLELMRIRFNPDKSA